MTTHCDQCHIKEGHLVQACRVGGNDQMGGTNKWSSKGEDGDRKCSGSGNSRKQSHRGIKSWSLGGGGSVEQEPGRGQGPKGLGGRAKECEFSLREKRNHWWICKQDFLKRIPQLLA